MLPKCSISFLVLALLANSCREEPLPKPRAQLRLEYQEAEHKDLETACPYQFQYNTLARLKQGDSCNLVLDYPEMKGSIFITYKKVGDRLNTLLADAQKLSYEHVVKADNISEQPFLNARDSVYGMFYDVTGDAASQSQFYVTDSTRHFVTGSLYFYAKPNYDSIYPAAVYLQEDIRHIMETFRWK